VHKNSKQLDQNCQKTWFLPYFNEMQTLALGLLDTMQTSWKMFQIYKGVPEFDLGKSREFSDSNLSLDYGEHLRVPRHISTFRLEMFAFSTFQLIGDLMKRFIIASLLVSAASVASADNVRLVNADSSSLSEICIAAVESRAAALDAAYELGLTPAELDQLKCNEMPLTQFVRTYRAPQKAVDTTYVLKRTDESALTELCLASVKSEEEFAAAKANLGSDVALKEVRCNNMSIAEFARKYGKTALTASVQ
jgi:hypothetical protein